jgi:hypothetical protein
MLFALGHGQKFVQLGAGLDVSVRTSEVAPLAATALIRPEPVAESQIVAETLLGLIANDPESYWNAPGSDGGRWQPSDAALGGNSVDSFEALFAFAGVL